MDKFFNLPIALILTCYEQSFNTQTLKLEMIEKETVI